MGRVPGLWVVGAVVVVVLALAPLVVPEGSLSLPAEIFFFALFALTYDLIFGYTGLISFGHALFIGVGGYTLANAMGAHGLSLWPALLVTLLAGITVSTVTGIVALRTRGVYFAMVTLAFAQAAYYLGESNVGNLTGGENGMQVTGVPGWLAGPGGLPHLYDVALGVLVGGFLLLRLFVNSPAGRVWQAIRENEGRAMMLGYHPFGFKLLAYAIAGTVATLGGAVYALDVGTVSTNLFSADMTIGLLLMVIIGGTGSLWGAVVGAAIIRSLEHYLTDLSTSDLLHHLPPPVQATLAQPLLLFGIIYLLLIYFFPQGIAGLAARLHAARSAVPAPGLGEIQADAAAGVGSAIRADETT